MARRRPKRRPKKISRKRESRYTSPKSRDLLPRSYYDKKQKKMVPGRRYQDRVPDRVIQDYRKWHPARSFIQHKLISGRPAAIKIPKKSYQGRRLDYRLSFRQPKSVVICRKRHARRVALFILQKIGAGKGVSRKRRRTEDSNIICERRKR